MNNNSSAASGGVGFFGLLTILFIALKLLKIINWSWWIVLSPLWAPVLLFFIVVTIIIILRR